MDTQRFNIIVESTLWTTKDLVWYPAPGLLSGLNPPALKVDSWDKKEASVLNITHHYDALDEDYARLTMSISLLRQSGYYMSRVVSNIIMLVIMASAVAFIPGAEADRLGFVQACFLGVVSTSRVHRHGVHHSTSQCGTSSY